MKWKWISIVAIGGISACWLWQLALKPVSAARCEARELLAALERECDPDSPDNNYEWLANSSPTEQRRMAIVSQLRKIGAPALSEIRALQRGGISHDETREMRVVAAAALGDPAAVLEAAKVMAWSGFPAVRICASQILRELKDPRTADWFCLALNDGRGVHNDHCGVRPELFYPVRADAQLALWEFGHSEEEIARWTLEGAGVP